MPILALGEEVLTSDAEFATDLVALRVLDVSDPVTSLDFLPLSIPGPLLLQVERASLPMRQLLRRFPRQEWNVCFDVTSSSSVELTAEAIEPDTLRRLVGDAVRSSATAATGPWSFSSAAASADPASIPPASPASP